MKSEFKENEWGWNESGPLSHRCQVVLKDLMQMEIAPVDLIDSTQANAIRKLANSANVKEPCNEFLFWAAALQLAYKCQTLDLNGLRKVLADSKRWYSYINSVITDLSAYEHERPTIALDLKRVIEAASDTLFQINSLQGTILSIEFVVGSAAKVAGREIKCSGTRPQPYILVIPTHAKVVFTQVVGRPPERGKAPSFRSFLEIFAELPKEQAVEAAKYLKL